jgi:hypothetical protein
MMKYSEDLQRTAKRVVWFKPPEETLNETKLFLAHVMTYGTLEDIVTAMKCYSDADFDLVLEAKTHQAPGTSVWANSRWGRGGTGSWW